MAARRLSRARWSAARPSKGRSVRSSWRARPAASTACCHDQITVPWYRLRSKADSRSVSAKAGLATTSPTPVKKSGRERPRHRGADLDRRIRGQIEEEQCEARVRVLDRDRRALGVECQGVKAHRLVPNRGQCRGGIHTDAGGVCLDLVAGVGWTEENGEEGRSRVRARPWPRRSRPQRSWPWRNRCAV